MLKGRLTGAISLDADVSGLIDDALTEAKHVCDANLGMAPEVVIRPDDDVRDDYRPPPIIRPWLHHAIVEAAKKAMNLNVIRWQHSPSSETSGNDAAGRAHQFRYDDGSDDGWFIVVVTGGGGGGE